MDMAHRRQSSATPRERRLSRVYSLFPWPQTEHEPKEETQPAATVSDWTTSRAARRVSFLDIQDSPEPLFSVRHAHHRLSVPPIFDFLAPSGNNWNTMSVRSRRSKATPPPLDISEDDIAGPSSSIATLALPPHQSKNQLFKRVLRRHGSFGSIRTLAVFSTRPGDRSSLESACSSSADSEHSLSGSTAYSPSDYGDSEKSKDVLVIEPDVDEDQIRRPVLVTPIMPDYAFEGCEGLLELDRETNDVLSHLTPLRCPSFLPWDQAPRQILDIGCGFGDWAAQAATAWPLARVTGVDVNSRWDVLSVEKIIPANVSFEEHDFLDEQLPFEEGSFDYIRIANCQFRVKPSQWRFLLSEAHRVLQMDGRLELIDEELLSPDTSFLERDQDKPQLRHRSSSESTEHPLDFGEPQDVPKDLDKPQSMEERMRRNCQELETIFHHALKATGLYPSRSQDDANVSLPEALRDAFGGAHVLTHAPYELCASLPKNRKTNKLLGIQREQNIILRSHELPGLRVPGQPGLRMLSLDTRYALRGSDALLACKEFIHSFVEQQVDVHGAALVSRKELDEALWDYESFRERRYLWRAAPYRNTFDDDADLIISRSRPGPRRSDGGDTGSMVVSMRRAFERTNSAGSDMHSFTTGGRKALERSYSFDSDALVRPFESAKWAPGEAYDLGYHRTLVPLRCFRVYDAVKEFRGSPLIAVHPGMPDYRKSFMERARSSTPICESP